MYRCYLFDFDYTLVDSTEGIVGCFLRTLAEMGRPPLPSLAIQRTIGLPMPEAVGRLLGTKDEATIEDFIRRYQPYADRYMTLGTHFSPACRRCWPSCGKAGRKSPSFLLKPAAAFRKSSTKAAQPRTLTSSSAVGKSPSPSPILKEFYKPSDAFLSLKKRFSTPGTAS